jgi:hypothetical protein
MVGRRHLPRDLGFVFLLVYILLLPAAHAADTHQRYAIHGPGAYSCQKLIDAQEKNAGESSIMLSWVLGYLTALNRTTPDRYDVTPIADAQGLFSVVYALCTRNPKLTLEATVAGLVSDVAKIAIHEDSPIVVVHAGGNDVKIRAATLAAMQAALAAMGRYNGKADGAFGPKFEAALRDYQHQEKLRETGLPDAATILRLLVERPANTPAKK